MLQNEQIPFCYISKCVNDVIFFTCYVTVYSCHCLLEHKNPETLVNTGVLYDINHIILYWKARKKKLGL